MSFYVVFEIYLGDLGLLLLLQNALHRMLVDDDADVADAGGTDAGKRDTTGRLYLSNNCPTPGKAVKLAVHISMQDQAMMLLLALLAASCSILNLSEGSSNQEESLEDRKQPAIALPHSNCISK